ncbi:MAG: hypothetical protein K6F84_05680 [Lachnospiraceae bacterium]|nr:hypothetical protein [Lachnospiraceae bacterium]
MFKKGIMLKKALVLGLSGLLLMSGCGNRKYSVTPKTGPSEESSLEETKEAEESVEEEVSEEEKTTSESSEEAKEGHNYTGGKEVIVYFANWNLDEKSAKDGGEVSGIPWESVTYINHAFWEVLPDDGSKETSFERRDNGDEPRTKFAIAPTDAYSDMQHEEESEEIQGLARNHFSEYAYFSEMYPDVNIMISVGGWTDCGYFSEMAYTKEGRESFTESCVELIKKYPWIDGIDIDWEYPGGSTDGERAPEDESDEGCPIWGTAAEDNQNFGELLKNMRERFDAEFGEGTKKLTACASASTGYTLCCQDWTLAEPYLNLINIMTYDLAGTWDASTGFMTSVNGAQTAAKYLKVKGIPVSKLNIGSPMYAMCEKMKKIDKSGIVGAPIESDAPNTEEIDQNTIREWEKSAQSGYTVVCDDEGRFVKGEEFDNETTGWHMKYHPVQGTVYMYNDDETSPYYCWYVSYENSASLQLKLDLIYDMDLAGIIVWEVSEDSTDKDLIRQMGQFLK